MIIVVLSFMGLCFEYLARPKGWEIGAIVFLILLVLALLSLARPPRYRH